MNGIYNKRIDCDVGYKVVVYYVDVNLIIFGVFNSFDLLKYKDILINDNNGLGRIENKEM